MGEVWSLSPESLHPVTSLCSDRGLPKSDRQMHGASSQTSRLINATHERCWGKFHVKTLQGIAGLTDREAATIVGHDRDSHPRALVDAIAGGDGPQWRRCVQVMPEPDAEPPPDHPFELTKVWPHPAYPRIEVGIMALTCTMVRGWQGHSSFLLARATRPTRRTDAG
jgi:catalase